ncbi:MAG: hypothetical protein ACT4PG_12390, partial [Panacagrimonas sp.]
MNLWQRTAACYEFFKQRHWLTEECWRIDARLGNPAPDSQKIWQTICDELGGRQGRLVASHVKQWLETENPYHVAASVALCDVYGFPITPTVQAQV